MYKIDTANVTIMVKDIQRSIDFYVDGLGLTLKQRWDDHYALVSAPGVVIGLHPSKGQVTSAQGISIGFGIATLADAEKRLKELQVSYDTTEDKAGNFASFTDPDGTPLYFMQSKVGDW